MTNDRMRKGVLAAGLFAFGCLSAPAAAAQEDPAQAEAAQTEAADSALAQYQFNLAPAQTAPGAQAEVLLTERPTGGYAVELQASSLPDPSSLKEGASTYVVWLYDAAAKKKERVAELPAAAGSGHSAFDILWPTFALVVTAEPSPEPLDWSGVAVLTGQPVVPPNPGPDVDAAQAASSAAAAEADAAAEAAVDSAASPPAAPAADAAAAEPPADAAAGVGVTASDDAAADSGVSVGVGADASAGVSAETPAPDPAPGEVDPTAAADAGEVVAAESEEEQEQEDKRKRRFKNDALDRMRAAAERGEEPAPAEEEQPEEDVGASEQLDAMAAAARGPELAAEFDLEGTGPADGSYGRVEVGVDGVARVSARKLPQPDEFGTDLNVFVLWGVDPASGLSRNLGVLQGSGDGVWSATLPELQPGAVVIVTAEAGPQGAVRSGPAVLSGRWEQ